MPQIVPAEVNQFLTQQSLSALCFSVPTAEPVTDDTRFFLTPKGEAALAACKSIPAPRVRPACPLCGSDVWQVSDRIGSFTECENPDCYFCETSGPCTEVADADCDYERNYERSVA